MGELTKFKNDCVINSYKQANGKIKSTSILHRPTALRVERFFGTTDGLSYNNAVVELLFAQLKGMVDQHNLRKQFERAVYD